MSEIEQLQPQVEQDTATKQAIRTLIDGGATYQDGVLVLTYDQIALIDTIDDQPKDPQTEVVISPYNPEVGNELLPISEHEMREENIKGLQDRIDSVLAPYAGLYSSKVPSPSRKDKNLFGKLKRESQTTEPLFEDKITRSLDIRYKTTLTYIPGEQRNQLSSVYVEMGSQSEGNEQFSLNSSNRGLIPRLLLSYDDNETLDRLKLTYFNKNDRDRWQLLLNSSSTEANANNEITQALHPYGDYTVEILLDARNAAILIGSFQYKFDASNNEFRFLGVPQVDDAPQSLSIDAYINFVEKILSALPQTREYLAGESK